MFDEYDDDDSKAEAEEEDQPEQDEGGDGVYQLNKAGEEFDEADDDDFFG